MTSFRSVADNFDASKYLFRNRLLRNLICHWSICLCCSLFAVFIVIPSVSLAEEAKATRPRIGLVLGGGGARGASHVGVLKVLEKNRIPIDYVVGTSMGSIVGGAYASGLSPEEIEIILLNIDWGNIFDERPLRSDITFRRKQDEKRFTGAEFGIKDGQLRLPKGVLSGRKLEFVLRKAFLHAAKIHDFDRLPLPFRAVATNIETGDAIVLAKGDLAKSIRASMSIPGAFPPVEIDGRELVDGYVSNNVPIDVAFAMGADIVIAVDVGTPLVNADKLSSLFDVASQASAIGTIKNVQEQLKKLRDVDVLISPELGDLSVSDFEKIGEIIPLGLVAAEKQTEKLQAYTTAEEDYKGFLHRQRKVIQSPIKISFIRIAPTERVPEGYIRTKIESKVGEDLDLEVLKKDLERIASIGEFENVSYILVSENGEIGLEYDAEEKSWGPHYLRVGFEISNNFDGDSQYNFQVEHLRSWMNKLGGEYRNRVKVGSTNSFFSDIYQPIDSEQRYFGFAQLELKQDLQDVYQGDTRIAEYRSRTFQAGPGLGINLGTLAEWRAGILWGTANAESITGNMDLPELNVNTAAVVTQLVYDSVDDANFPREGVYSSVQYESEQEGLGAEQSYDKLEVKTFVPITVMQRHTITPIVYGGFNFGDDSPFYDQFTLGGPNSLAGYRTDELRGKDALSGRLLYYYLFSEETVAFARKTYLGASIEAGNVWEEYDDVSAADLVVGGSFFVAFDTRAGPVYLSFGMNEDNEDGEVNLSIGQRF